MAFGKGFQYEVNSCLRQEFRGNAFWGEQMEPVKIIKDGFTIKEAMDVYGLTVDALYYYEKKGLISPQRDPNNQYRIFMADDFKRLSIISELKSLGFSVSQIKEYLDQHTLRATEELLRDELIEIDKTIDRCLMTKMNILACIKRYSMANAAADDEEITIQHIPARSCLLVTEDIIAYDDLPYLFASKSRDCIYSSGIMHSTCCYAVDPDVKDNNGFFAPQATLLQFETNPLDAGYTLDAGLYAICTFRGGFDRAPEMYKKMLSHIDEAGYAPNGLLIEQCIVGEYESGNRDEYVTRLELPVKPI